MNTSKITQQFDISSIPEKISGLLPNGLYLVLEHKLIRTIHMSVFMDRLHAKALLALAIAFCLGVGNVDAAPINYGDFAGSSVMYLDVTETANSPIGAEPLFGAPFISGDQLRFTPKGFSASSVGANAATTDGQLNFDLMGLGSAINSLSFSERGDYNFSGAGSVATQVTFSIALADLTVLAIDGVDLDSAVSLDVDSAFKTGTRNVVLNGEGTGNWSLTLDPFDVDSALTAAGLNYQFGATKLRIAVDDTLTASSELITKVIDEGTTTTFPTTAFIAKKGFTIGGETTTIPEPSSLAMLAVAACGTGAMRRRRR